jgi:sterol desaturase/sphingolipid hydroxylase (fatty acid hydroxylase superfamily)
LTGVIATVWLSVRYQWDPGKVYARATLVLVAILIAVERLAPLRKEWSMTGKSFLRDLGYIAFAAPTIALAKAGFGFLAIRYSQQHAGPFSALPIPVAALGFLLTFEFFQYWFHRYSHSDRGPLGRFLWKAHLAHHLPDKVYVVMHAVFHPLNALITTAILQIPLLALGVPPAAVLATTLLIDLQSLVSHFNADIRAGFFNYIFIGTELHRHHHSADTRETGNFGNTLAVWDLVFRTHRYHPGRDPERLGLASGAGLPRSENVLRVLALPFAG